MCQEAAHDLRLSDTIASLSTGADKLEGCYYFNDASLWLNNNAANIGRGQNTNDK